MNVIFYGMFYIYRQTAGMRKSATYLFRGLTAGTLVLLVGLFSASCLRDLPGSLPHRIAWDPEFAFPLGEKQFGMNPESGFDTALFGSFDTLTGLPAWVYEEELKFEGTLDFDLASISENLDQLDMLLLRITIENGFPQEFLTQGYFVPQDRTPVDSVFPGGPVILRPGTPVNGGESVRPYTLTEDVVFPRERLLALQDVTAILLRVILRNVQLDTAHIPYYRSYHFDVRMGAMLDLDLDLEY